MHTEPAANLDCQSLTSASALRVPAATKQHHNASNELLTAISHNADTAAMVKVPDMRGVLRGFSTLQTDLAAVLLCLVWAATLGATLIVTKYKGEVTLYSH